MIKHCANCGKEITDKSFQLTRYCDECLRESKLKHCADCGKEITEKSFQLTRYCDECLRERKRKKRIRHKNLYKKTKL